MVKDLYWESFIWKGNKEILKPISSFISFDIAAKILLESILTILIAFLGNVWRVGCIPFNISHESD